MYRAHDFHERVEGFLQDSLSSTLWTELLPLRASVLLLYRWRVSG